MSGVKRSHYPQGVFCCVIYWLASCREAHVPRLKSKRLFISHSWSDGDAYEKLVALLDSAPNFGYKNYSVPKDDPVHNAPNAEGLYKAIKKQMVFCDVVLILAGEYTTYGKWIQREIQIAKKDYSKPILAIQPWASEQTSPVVSGAADRLVGWDTNSIVSAIRELDP